MMKKNQNISGRKEKEKKDDEDEDTLKTEDEDEEVVHPQVQQHDEPRRVHQLEGSHTGTQFNFKDKIKIGSQGSGSNINLSGGDIISTPEKRDSSSSKYYTYRECEE